MFHNRKRPNEQRREDEKAKKPSHSLYGVCSLILLPYFATGDNDTGGKFSADVVNTGGKSVSRTLVAKFATGVVDTGDAP
jgi:hypothetical protein